MSTLTPRELRTVAAIIDGLNKARTLNSRMGVPTTPDVLHARFPTGLDAVIRWTTAVRSDNPQRQRHIEQRARHRDGYVLDLDTPFDLAAAVRLHEPQKVTRNRMRVEINGAPALTDALRHLPPQSLGG